MNMMKDLWTLKNNNSNWKYKTCTTLVLSWV